jgi:bisphosphoglycerate-independent phosphoglycerate mutase (AlkP superfamily)
MAVKYAGIHLKSTQDLHNGDALSADFTGNGWRDHLNIPDVPVYSTLDAGARLADLAQKHDFSFFEYWLSDYAGHRGDMQQSCRLLEEFDQVLGGLVAAWDSIEGLIFITSDHGNMEDTTSRRHTCNHVPGLVIGPPSLRRKFTHELSDLTGISTAIMRLFD